MNNRLMFEFVSKIVDEMTNVSAQLPGIESPAKPASYFKNQYPEDEEESESITGLKKYMSPDE